jgi:hypothetical protein
VFGMAVEMGRAAWLLLVAILIVSALPALICRLFC